MTYFGFFEHPCELVQWNRGYGGNYLLGFKTENDSETGVVESCNEPSIFTLKTPRCSNPGRKSPLYSFLQLYKPQAEPAYY